jgi:hypothetical protein
MAYRPDEGWHHALCCNYFSATCESEISLFLFEYTYGKGGSAKQIKSENLKLKSKN